MSVGDSKAARDGNWRALMTRAQSGDAAAYTQLMREVTPLLRAVAAKRFRSSDTIEDHVQDILLSLHAARHTYDPQREFTPWLMALARHRVMDGLRRQMRRDAWEDSDVGLEEIATEAPEMIMWGTDARRLANAIRDLPDGQRKAIELVKLREMSIKDAARASGTSAGSIKMALHRALKSLRSGLGMGDPG